MNQTLKKELKNFLIAPNDPKATWRSRLLNAYAKALEDSISNGALFTSTESSKANLFSKGAVIEYEFSIQTIVQLSQNNHLYIGIEDDIEVAFIGIVGIESLVNGIISSRGVPIQDGLIFEKGSEHPIWGSINGVRP
jgi:hypothetical protein